VITTVGEHDDVTIVHAGDIGPPRVVHDHRQIAEHAVQSVGDDPAPDDVNRR
jgi:hypothetical protein